MSCEQSANAVGHNCGCDAKFLEQQWPGCAGPEVIKTYYRPLHSDIPVPALWRPSFDRNSGGDGWIEYGIAVRGILGIEPFQARKARHIDLDTLCRQEFCRLESHLHLGTGGQDQRLRPSRVASPSIVDLADQVSATSYTIAHALDRGFCYR
jgi:hypothetical protein